MENQILYDSATIADNIKATAKSKGVALKVMLSELSFNVNALSSLRHGKMISADRLAKIADYLECSVDYLLGRDENIMVNSDIHITHNVEESADDWGNLFSEFTANELMQIMRILSDTVQKKMNCD